MKKTTAGFIMKKVIAIAMIYLGLYLLEAYLSKTLPFDIVTNNTIVWAFWVYTGWIWGLMPVSYGVMLLFSKTISSYIRKLEMEM